MKPFQWETSEPELAKLIAHSEAFGCTHLLEESELFSGFLNLAQTATKVATHTRVETSVKVTELSVHPMRFNFWMVGANMNCWHHVRHFIEQRGELPPLIAAICEQDAQRGIAQFVVGVDLRATDSESRAKLWLLLHDRPRLVNQILEWSEINCDAFIALRSYDNFLVGLDLYPGGRVDAKIYFRHVVRHLDLSNADRHVSAWTSELIRESEVVHFLFRQDDRRVSYFAPHNPKEFMKMLTTTDLPNLTQSFDALAFGLDMVGLPEEDLKVGALRSCNLYSGFNSVYPASQESTVLFG